MEKVGGQDLRRDSLTLLLLLFLCLNTVWSIMAADWCEGLYILQPVVLGAVLIGWLLGRSRWWNLVTHLYALVFGAVSGLLLVGTLLPQELSWADRIWNLADRLRAFVEVLITTGVNYDNLMFVLELMLVLGLLSYLAAWHLFRKGRVWPAVTFQGLAVLINLSSTVSARLSVYLVLYFLAAMFLVLQVNLASRMSEWRRGKVRFGPEVSFDLARYGLILTLLLIGFAWVAPTVTASGPILRLTRGLEEPWDAFLDQWNRLFAALNYQLYRPGDWFGHSMVLGGPVQLGDEPIADVEGGSGRYWRAMAYDFYTGQEWMLSEADEVPAGPEAETFALPPFEARRVISQTVTVFRPGNRLLIGSSQPLPMVSIPATAELFFMPPQEATGGLPPPDLFALYAKNRLRTGDEYWIWSSVTDVDVQSLQEAGLSYPRWVIERYLQLPETLPSRVRALAEEITAPYDTLYDKATALEKFLRAYPYNEQIPGPDPGQDAVDYFLFDIREGYCNYYASAMVVMARAAGIPARLVAGYAGGEYLSDAGVHRIREKDSHAWVEVFFPRYGWVEFEPTAAQPAIERRQRRAGAAQPSGSRGGEEEDLFPWEDEEKYGVGEGPIEGGGLGGMLARQWALWMQRHWRWVVVVAGLAFTAVAGGWLVWNRLEPRGLTPIERAYERMLRAGRWLGALRDRGQRTPLELGSALAQRVPEGMAHIGGLTSLYVRYRYGGKPLEEGETREGLQHWAELRRPLLWAVLRQAGMSLVARLPVIDGRPRRFFASLLARAGARRGPGSLLGR